MFKTQISQCKVVFLIDNKFRGGCADWKANNPSRLRYGFRMMRQAMYSKCKGTNLF